MTNIEVAENADSFLIRSILPFHFEEDLQIKKAQLQSNSTYQHPKRDAPNTFRNVLRTVSRRRHVTGTA